VTAIPTPAYETVIVVEVAVQVHGRSLLLSMPSVIERKDSRQAPSGSNRQVIVWTVLGMSPVTTPRQLPIKASG